MGITEEQDKDTHMAQFCHSVTVFHLLYQWKLCICGLIHAHCYFQMDIITQDEPSGAREDGDCADINYLDE